MELFIGGFVLAKIPGQTEIGSGSGNFTFSNRYRCTVFGRSTDGMFDISITGNIKTDGLHIEISGLRISGGCQWNLHFACIWKIYIRKFYRSMECTTFIFWVTSAAIDTIDVPGSQIDRIIDDNTIRKKPVAQGFDTIWGCFTVDGK